MDHFMNIIVNIIVFLSRFAPILAKTGLLDYRSPKDLKDDPKLHILLVGYNGARNTGSDVRVAEIVRQLKGHFSSDEAEISVMTMDEESMRGYFDDDVHLIYCNSIFLWDLFKACSANQAVILCEGSTLKSKFANALTLYSCEAAGIMKVQHKPCIAYGSEADKMDPYLARTVKRLCTDTYFIARTKRSLHRIQALGLHGHMGTDAAWEFDSSSYDAWADAKLKQSGWDGTSPLLGVAPINPFWWPVRPSLMKWIRARLTGHKALQFRLWYFFSWSKQRKQQFDHYLDAIAQAVNEFASEHSCPVVLLGMEQLDTDAVKKLRKRLTVPSSIFLSENHDGYQMAALLKKLSFLITSRYHAEVLSMEAEVPCVAISMDERLDGIMQEMHMDQYQLLHADDSNLYAELMLSLEYVQSHRTKIKEELGRQALDHRATLDQMGDFLIQWLLSSLDEV